MATGAAVNTAAAGQAPQVPKKDVAGVLAAVASSKVEAFSGTVVSRSDLGLPQIPEGLTAGGEARHSRRSGGTASNSSATSASAADPQALLIRLLTGATTVRLWVDGPTREHAQVLDQYDQIDLVRNGTTAWTYVSSENAAVHYSLPARHVGVKSDQPPATPPTPAELAQRLLAAADPTTRVSLGTPQEVAGRAAWTVLLTPRTQGTLVAQVSIAVDEKTGMPLRVEIVARGQDHAAVDVGFTSIDFATPAATRFSFTPPSGATVTQKTVPAGHPHSGRATGSAEAGTANPGTIAAKVTGPGSPTVIGQGWTTVLEFTGVDLSSVAPALSTVSTAVTGGRAVRTALLTVFIAGDGRVFAGAVPLATLQAAAG